MSAPATITQETSISDRRLMKSLSASVDQVDDDIRNDLAAKHRRFVVAHRSNNTDEFKAAAEALAKHCLGVAAVVASIVKEISK